MSDALDKTPAETSSLPAVQLSLPGAEEMFAAVGLDTLPHGATDLSRRQLQFAVNYLRCGIATQAAREAGLSASNASKLLKNTCVSRFINAASKTVAQNGDQLVKRAWERSVSLHAELMEIRAIERAKRTKADHAREGQIMLQLTRNDMLLAALLNRLGIKLSGEVTHTVQNAAGGDFIVVPPDALPGLAMMRREVAEAHQAGGRN